MNVVIGSAFRNSGGRVMPYMERVAALRDALQGAGRVRVAAVEGDSVDNTRRALELAARFHNLDLDLVTCNHGGPEFGSTEAPARMVALSKVGNAIFDAVRQDDDVLVYVESDLLWDAGTIQRLISLAMRAIHTGFDVVAPLVMAGEAFYDIWGFRELDGRRWSPFEHRTLRAYHPQGLIEVGSVGSCLVMGAHVARKCRIKNDYCLVGWCEDARANGYRIGVNPDLIVRQL